MDARSVPRSFHVCEMPTGPMPLLQTIKRHLVKARGLDLSRYKESYLRRRLLVRVRALKLSNIDAYARYLKRHPEEGALLERTLSIKVTGFFRNRSCFAYLRERVVPQLLQRAADRRRRVQVWSAGCATGQETYSLAVLFALSSGAKPHRVRIVGTDVDAAALDTARQGRFATPAVLADVPQEAASLFALDASGFASAGPTLRRLVAFERESLLEPFRRRDLDLVVCRNVLIYFSLEHQETILSRFAAALQPGGFLVLGRVERLFGPARGLFEVVSARDRIYRRLPPQDGASPQAMEGAACA